MESAENCTTVSAVYGTVHPLSVYHPSKAYPLRAGSFDGGAAKYPLPLRMVVYPVNCTYWYPLSESYMNTA